MGKKNTKKNKNKKKKKNAAKKKKMNLVEGESSAAGENAVSSERNSSPEPETQLGGNTSSSSEEEKDERETERERIDEEDSWIINQDSSERKPSSVLFANVPILLFSTMLDSTDADPAVNRVALNWCHQRMLEALTLTLNFDKIPYVKVLARDPQKREHQLRFSRFDGTVVLHHGWDKIVAENGLKEGNIVMGRGCYIGGQYRMVLSFENISVDGISSERNQERMFFLFEKTLDKADLKQRLVISCCNERLKIALEQSEEPYVMVFAKGDEEKELLELWFSQHDAEGEGTYILHHDWENIVAQHGLEEGDLVTALGNVFSFGFMMLICVFKKGETGIPMLNQVPPIMLFQKKLESSDTNDRVVIESCKDLVKEIVARAEVVAADSDGYVMVFADDEGDHEYELRLSRDIPNGGFVLHHEWRDFVADNGLMSGDTVSCWGGIAEDGTIHMTFDVVKALENVGSERH